MKPINDHLKENLDILFVGFNPSVRSGETGHHFANPNNRFWKILFEAGLTPRKFRAAEDSQLPGLGYGLTNIVARPTKTADEITKEEYREGRVLLKRKIEHYRPKIVCFVGKGVYQEYSGRKQVPWGPQPDSVVPGTLDFVAPSSSGLVRMKMEEIIHIYKQLLPFVSSLAEKEGHTE
ncbi:mismatch-specific DNA-glycosylase [Domibacillus indicus]|uniref:mismatch-specific DNA-glycosylase n=1 Tax=Domibacillus indicus TaxID=1437523 RepID=UPI0006180D8E|nr:mismatch-specific DNA-glycosylase [Domibacillus indicus]